MEFKVDGWNNFCRVFELPESYPRGFCFGGGRPVNFQMVDWFNPISGIHQPSVSEEVWLEKVGKKPIKTITIDELNETLIPWLKDKSYVKSGKEFIVICDFGAVLKFKG